MIKLKVVRIIVKKYYFKSPMIYMGNKYKLLPQLYDLFPKNINNFYDIFCGGLNVSLNINAKKVFSNDKHEDLIWLYNEILNHNSDTLGEELLDLDNKYFPMNTYKGKSLNTYIRSYDKEDKNIYNELMNKKRIVYYKLRDEFNKTPNFKILLLLIFNSVGISNFEVTNKQCTYTCGNLRVNKKTVEKVNILKNKLKDIQLSCNDFRYIKNVNFKNNDFVYLDPPYLRTRQYKIIWSEKDELDLYDILDYLNSIKVKFALSNFKDGINHTNNYLCKLYKKYNLHILNDNHTNLNGISKKGIRQEILITNY